MSIGVSESPGLPPIVPLMPEIDFINAILCRFLVKCKGAKKIGEKPVNSCKFAP
jgi:hypothetical protein